MSKLAEEGDLERLQTNGFRLSRVPNQAQPSLRCQASKRQGHLEDWVLRRVVLTLLKEPAQLVAARDLEVGLVERQEEGAILVEQEALDRHQRHLPQILFIVPLISHPGLGQIRPLPRRRVSTSRGCME